MRPATNFPRRLRPGGVDALELQQSSVLKDGPDHAKQLFAWPSRHLNMLVDPQHEGADMRAGALQRNMRRPMTVRSHCSGVGTGEDAVRHTVTACIESRLCTKDDVDVSYACAWDHDEHCLQILCGRKPGLQHVHRDMNDVLPKSLRKSIDDMEPPAQATQEERRAAYLEIHKLICEKGPEIYTETTTSPCLLHGGDHCPVFDEGSFNKDDQYSDNDSDRSMPPLLPDSSEDTWLLCFTRY
jgi:hypothetical protein